MLKRGECCTLAPLPTASFGETARSKPLVEITATRGWRSLGLREIYEYRELLGIFVWRDVKVRYRQTLLGVVWVVAQPLLTMFFFTFLFSRVAGLRAGNVPYSLFVLSALVPWTFCTDRV